MDTELQFCKMSKLWGTVSQWCEYMNYWTVHLKMTKKSILFFYQVHFIMIKKEKKFFCLFRAIPVAYGGSQARVQLELLPLAYARATATPDPSFICDLHHSSRQRWILNPLSKARDRSYNLTVPSQIPFHCAMMGTPRGKKFKTELARMWRNSKSHSLLVGM